MSLRTMLLGGFLLATTSACGDACDAGYELRDHLCFATAPDAGSGGAAGSPDGGDPTDAAAGAAACDSTFGASCTSDADCSCDSSFCAALPGQAGFCTRTGCLDDPEVCPAGYGCLDISTFQPGLPAICVPPS